MDDHDALGSLDTTGELQGYVKSRQWSVVADFCDKKRRKGSGDGLQVANPGPSLRLLKLEPTELILESAG